MTSARDHLLHAAAAEPLKYGLPYRQALRSSGQSGDGEGQWVSYSRLHRALSPLRRGADAQQTLEVARLLALRGELEMHAGQHAFRACL